MRLVWSRRAFTLIELLVVVAIIALLIAMLLWRLLTYYFGIIMGALVMLVSRKRQRAIVRLPL